MAAESVSLELLAPARDADTALAAITHGADAVYMGGPAFGARSAAGNSIADIRRVVEAAAPFGVKVYVTLNTILYDDELEPARRLVHELYDAGVDALIVQDMALLEMDIPPIELHASTQCDTRTPEKAAMLARAGFSQIVLPREFSLRQIAEAAKAAPEAAMEVFVHGALCVSYSGDCQAGFVTAGRSANRGCCPQICRLEFRLTDAAGKTVAPPDGDRATRHWLSLADMNRLASLAELAEAGARSFKIEGRLKNASYVKQVTAAYSAALDRLVAESGGRYRRSSSGRSTAQFVPDLSACFNRGFTPYFLHEGTDEKVSSTLTPKWTGPRVATFVRRQGAALRIRTDAAIAAGDGLGWFGPDGRFRGFRVNRAEADMIFPAPKSDIPDRAGTPLYRNLDTAVESALSRPDSASRTIAVDAVLSAGADGHITLRLTDSRGIEATATTEGTFTDTARNDQTAYRRDIFGRLGGTPYSLDSYRDEAPQTFIPAKELATLRRDAIAALDRQWAGRPRSEKRRTGALAPDEFAGQQLSYHDNVSNRLSERFYLSHGATMGQHALESEPRKGQLRVMTTRYCLRREQGACLRKPDEARRLPDGDLFLEAPVGRLRLHCDCTNCQMHIFIDRP